MKACLEEMKAAYPGKHIVLMWDNAPCHRLRTFQEMESITAIPFSPYSPQLNPPEWLFGELRKSTTDRIFETIGSQEEVITEKLLEYADDYEKMKGLTGYGWIREQWNLVF